MNNAKFINLLKFCYAKIPLLIKDIIRQNYNKLISKKYNEAKLAYDTTGGLRADQILF